MNNKSLNSKNLQVRIPSEGGTIDVDLPRVNTFNRINCNFASIPKSWFMIDGNLQLPTFTDSLGTYTMSFSIGNYNQTAFAAELKLQLEAISTFTYTVAFNVRTNKILITSTGPTITFNYAYTEVKDLAFDRYLGSPINGVGSISSNFQRYEVVQVRSSWVDNYGDQILVSVIASDVSYFDKIEYDSAGPEYTKCGMINSENSYPTFYVSDIWGTKILMNGLSSNLLITCFEEN